MSSRAQRARREPAAGSSATPGAGPSRPRRQTRTQKQEEEDAEKAKQRAQGGAADEEADEDDDYWDVVQVLDERHDAYLLQWADVNPATGEIWDPSWEPRSYVSEVLVQEWAEKKAQDPTIVGVEGKKLKELRKARALAARKRKREEKEVTAATAAVAGIKRSRHDISRGSTGTPGASKPVAATPGPSSSIKREPGLPSHAGHTNGTSADPVIIDDDDEDEVPAVQPQGRSASASTSSRGKRTVEVVIDVPAPTTTQQDSTLAGPLADDEVAADDLLASQQLDGDAVAIDHTDVTDEPPVEAPFEVLPVADAGTPDDGLEEEPQADLVMEVQVEEEVTQDDQADISASAEIAGTLDETRELGPIPVPTATQFRAALPPALHAAAAAVENNTQSATSVGATQLDPIQQFSSPVREPHAAGKGKGKSAPEPSNALDETAAAHDQPTDGPKTVKRFINGEQVMAIESQSSDEDEGGTGDGESPGTPAPEAILPDDPAPPAIFEELMQVEIVEGTIIESEEPVHSAAAAPTSPAPVVQQKEAPVTAPAFEKEPSAEPEAPPAVQSQARTPTTTTSNEIDVLAALLQSLSEATSEQTPVETFNIEDHELTPAGRAIAEALQNGQAETKRWRIRAKKAEKAAKKATEDAQQDLAFIREQYNNASNSAVAAVNKSEELEAKMEILQGQLKFGLKQRETHTAAIKAQHDTEVAKLRAQLQLYLSQNRQTDDRVRAKAVAHDRLKKELEAKQAHIDFLAGMNNDLSTKIKDLSIRNDELLGQVEVLRARELGVIGPQADSDAEDAQNDGSGSDYQSEGSYTSSDSDLPPNGAPTSMVMHAPHEEPLTASQLMPDSQDLAPYSSSPPALDEVQVLAEPTRRDHHGPAHRSPDTPDLFFADAAAVKEHVMQNVDAAFS